VDASYHEVVIPDTTHLTFTIIQNEPWWGWFINPSGDFTISPLQNVTYGDARAGKVFLWSTDYSDSLLGGLRSVRVRVEGGLRTGVNNIYLGTVTLKFDGLDSLEVYPNYPLNNNSTNKSDTLNLTLRSRYGTSNVVAGNVTVKVGPSALADSGGHSHDGKRPLGKCQTYNGTKWNTVDSLQQATDGTGTLNFKYVASQFGGKERVKATRVFPVWSPNPETHAFKKIKTRVPNLNPLQSGVNHVMTATSDSAKKYHRLENSDYGLDTVRAFIDSIALSYATKYGLPDTCYLAVIDMSLPLGGGFDVKGKWQNSFMPDSGGHVWHRQGRSIDFGHKYIGASGQYLTSVPIKVKGQVRKLAATVDEALLDKLFGDKGFKRYEKPQNLIHYEFLPRPN
jgi:hypothetical protein